MNEAKYVSEIPSLEKLKSFTSIDQFVELFGREGAFFDEGLFNWQVFSIESKNEIEVMKVFIDRRDNTLPRTEVQFGVLKTVK